MQAIQQSVQSIIDAGRIGSPVFLRLMVQFSDEAVRIESTLASLATLANTWMPSPAESIYVPVRESGTQSTAFIQYTGGQTAILSVSRLPAGQDPSVDVTLVGNKGAIYHETPSGRHALMSPTIQLSGGEALKDVIHQALQINTPIRLGT